MAVSKKQQKIDAIKKRMTASSKSKAKKVMKVSGRKPRGDVSIKQMVSDLFTADKNAELSTTHVVETLKAKNPEIKDNSVRFMITQLKADGVIREMRRDGRISILKASEPGSMPVIKAAKGKALKGSKAYLTDSQILMEAAGVITKLQQLVARNKDIVEQIERFKSSL